MVRAIRKYPAAPDPRSPLWGQDDGYYFLCPPWVWEQVSSGTQSFAYQGPWSNDEVFNLPLQILRGVGDGKTATESQWTHDPIDVLFPDSVTRSVQITVYRSVLRIPGRVYYDSFVDVSGALFLYQGLGGGVEFHDAFMREFKDLLLTGTYVADPNDPGAVGLIYGATLRPQRWDFGLPGATGQDDAPTLADLPPV